VKAPHTTKKRIKHKKQQNTPPKHNTKKKRKKEKKPTTRQKSAFGRERGEGWAGKEKLPSGLGLPQKRKKGREATSPYFHFYNGQI